MPVEQDWSTVDGAPCCRLAGPPAGLHPRARAGRWACPTPRFRPHPKGSSLTFEARFRRHRVLEAFPDYASLFFLGALQPLSGCDSPLDHSPTPLQEKGRSVCSRLSPGTYVLGSVFKRVGEGEAWACVGLRGVARGVPSGGGSPGRKAGRLGAGGHVDGHCAP